MMHAPAVLERKRSVLRMVSLVTSWGGALLAILATMYTLIINFILLSFTQ